MAEGYKKRIHFIDEMRGILIIYVVLYHLLYDISQIFWVGSIDFMYSPWMNMLRDTMTGSLIAISGISCEFSRSNVKRGLKLFGTGMVLTAFTGTFIPSEFILFGILHFFGISILIYALLRNVLAKIPVISGFIGSVYLFFWTFHLYEGYVGILTKIPVKLPEQIRNLKIFYPIGFPVKGLYSADYYPIIPWIFLLFAGTFLGRFLKRGNLPEYAYRIHSKSLSFLGTHTLLIYIIHQPVIYIILYICQEVSLLL